MVRELRGHSAELRRVKYPRGVKQGTLAGFEIFSKNASLFSAIFSFQ